MMRSIFVKVLLWFAVTLLVCIAGSALTNWLENRFAPDRFDFFSRSLNLEAGEASHAYQTGGKAALKDYISRLETLFPGKHTLVDSSGTDLLSGRNRSNELRNVGPHWSPGSQPRMLLAWPSPDQKYRLVIDAVPPPGPWSPIPYFLWIAAAAVAFSYILAVQLASPLRGLQQAVERFGRGDLAARAAIKSQDEIGKLAQSFNVMAERIETLLTAERRLLQDVSHELRSPLARLEFAVELARTAPDRNTSLDRIKKEVERLTTLVSELLQVTRAESDPQSRNISSISMRALLKDVLDLSTVESQAHQVQLHLDAVEPLDLLGDRELLRRAIENVLRNAIRYAPEGSSIDVTLRREGKNAVIAIRDYGPGVPEESLSSLFKPFFRAEADRNRNSGGGVGLGLSIAERAIALHQGQMRASNARPGLLVEIQLPATATASPQLTALNS